MKKCTLLSLLPILLSSTGLYGQWITGFYSAQNGVLPVSSIPWDKYTHIIHFAAAPNSDGTVDLHYLSQNEIASITAARPPGKNVIVSIKDNDSNWNAFAAATSPGTIATFVNNIANFVNSNDYDGVDIDWEASINTTQYQDLLKRLRNALPGKVIAMDAGNFGGLQTVAAGAASALDQVNVMCYDMDTPGNGYSWFNDALLQNGDTTLMTCDWRVRSMTNAGLPASKIGIGIPFYGRRWSGITQPLVPGSFNPTWFPYRNLVTDGTRWQSQFRYYDTRHKANYLSIPGLNEFDSYNGVEFIQDAVAWKEAQGFGGFMTFTLEYEYLANQTGDARFPLSSALSGVLSGTGTSPESSPGPVLSSGSPSGTLNTWTTSAKVSVASNVNATCRYAMKAGTTYSAMPYSYSVTGGTAHSMTTVGLRSGASYHYYSRCQDTLGNQDTTDYPISFSIASPATGSSGPTPLSVTPSSGSASAQSFTFQVSDPSGYEDVKEVDAVFGTAVGQTNSCRVQYWPATNTLFLQSDDATSWAQATLGSSTILRNSQCSVNPAASSVSGTGTALNATFAMTFTSGYAGPKSSFVFVAGASLNSGWVTLGTWTVPRAAAVVTGRPPALHLAPNDGAGSSVTYSLVLTDGASYSNIAQGALIIGNTVGATNSCFINYSAPTNTLSLLSDDNTTWSQATVGASVVLQNSQCSVNAAFATATGSGNTMIVKLPVTFSTNYTGRHTLFMLGANKAGQSSGWRNHGSWMVSIRTH